jgi:hypothetical protein
MTEFIEIIRKGERKGIRIPKQNYECIAAFILEELESSDGEIQLGHLLDQANTKLGPVIRGDVHWHILHIKQHMEANRIIKSTIDRKRIQRIQLLKNGLKKTRV